MAQYSLIRYIYDFLRYTLIGCILLGVVIFFPVSLYEILFSSDFDNTYNYLFVTDVNKYVFSEEDTIEVALTIKDIYQKGIRLKNSDSFTWFWINGKVIQNLQNKESCRIPFDLPIVKQYNCVPGEDLKKVYTGKFLKKNSKNFLIIKGFDTQEIELNTEYRFSVHWKPVVANLFGMGGPPEYEYVKFLVKREKF